MKNGCYFSTCIGILITLLAFRIAGDELPDLVPMPKKYQATGKIFTISDQPIFIAGNNRQCEIAASEITKQVEYLGGKPSTIKTASGIDEKGIYILPCTDPLAKQLLKKHSLEITPEKPGSQGYVIETYTDKVLVIGSDNIGTLYGAMTLRQMMEVGADNKVIIKSAKVHDYPDYRFRSNMSFRRGIEYWATGEKDKREAYKQAMTWFMRFKINLVNDYRNIHNDLRNISEDNRKFIKEINAFAVERGIYPILWSFTNVVNTYADKEKEYENWDCISVLNGKHCFCWSRDELAQKKINRTVDFCKEMNFRILCLHSVDGGGVKDPELWSKRCKQCRARWKDDERWKATVHQINMWADAIKKRDPGLIFSFVPYLYAASLAYYETCSTRVDRPTWKMNVIDYWKNINAHLDPICIPQTWMSTPEPMKKFREYFQGRPIVVFGHSTRVGGYFGTWHRFNKTNYSGNPKDMFFLQGGFDRFERWMNLICDAEFCWNTNAPGSENFTGLYYDIENEHTKPEVIVNEWLPRACRAFYGQKVGKRIVPLYQAGVQNNFIMNPGVTLRYANKYRRMPLGALDPLAKNQKGLGKTAAADVEDSLERREAQIVAVKKAQAALDAAYPFIDTLDKYQRKSFMYFYKRMPFWYLTARVRYTLFKAGKFLREGKHVEAAKILEQGLKDYEKDYVIASKVLEQTKKEPDLNRWGLFVRGDIKPTPQELKKLLEEKLASAKITLKPRRPGKFIKVGIFNGFGKAGTVEFFKGFKNVKTEVIKSLSLAVLDRFDCIIMLQSMTMNDKGDYFNNLRRYVIEGGGGVLFQHDMCGFERFVFGKKTPFPEICPYATGKKNSDGVTIEKEHQVIMKTPKGQQVKYMYYDHIMPKAGDDGQVIAVDKDGDPVIVIGTIGHGKVVFDGTVNLDKAKGDIHLQNLNALIAQGAVEWFTGVKLLKN